MTRRRSHDPVRRSTRIRQNTSPYFKVKVEECLPLAAPRKQNTPAGCHLKAPIGSSKARLIKVEPSQNTSKVEQQDDLVPTAETERVHGLARQVNFYGPIQEIVTPNVFRLLVATCLLNQTKGRAAMPVFWELLQRWPDEQHLARADVAELTDLLQPIGLHNIRAKRLINMSQTMVEIPYDENNSFKSRDRTAPDTPIGMYPGVGRYAIDSWRIFVAGGGASVGLQGDKLVSPFDTTWAAATDVAAIPPCNPPNVTIEPPEWKSVMPLDKELRAYLIWRWAKEGEVWDPLRGLVKKSADP